MAAQTNLTLKQQIRAITGVGALTFKTAPGAVIFKLLGAVINAILPIITTLYAARTTTALAAAYSGQPGAKAHVMSYVVITAVLGLVMTAWSSLDNYVQAQLRYVVETRVSNQMFRQFLALDFWQYDDKDTADLYDRAQKFSQFFAWIFDRVATIASSLIGLVSALVALFLVNKILALAILIATIPGIYVQFKLSRRQIHHWNHNVEVRRSLSLIEWNMLQPRFIGELRMYNMVDYLLKLRTKLRDKDEKARLEIERSTVPLTLLADALQAVAEVGALIWVSLQVIARRQPLGQFLYVQQIVSRAISSASTAVSTLSSIDEDIANLYDYEKFMHLPARQTGGVEVAETPEKIVFDDVSFRYPGDKSPEVLKHINLTIPKNQNIAIVGENGAGKTTLIKLLCGIYAPTSGAVELDGSNLRDIDISSWHRQLGVLQQAFINYGFATAADNVRFGDVNAKYTKERLNSALAAAEATNFTAKLSKGIDSYVNSWMEDDEGNKGKDLSGGQWQRLALARDFYRQAPIVILDEPTSAIDAMAEARIFKRLFSEGDRTVITISHRLSTVKKADVIHMLKDGEIVESGTYDELLAKKGDFYTMFESQINA